MNSAIIRSVFVWVGLIAIQPGSPTNAQSRAKVTSSDSIVVVIESQQDVFVGQRCEVPIIVHEAPAAMESMDLTIAYDPNVLTLVDVISMSGVVNPVLEWDTLFYDNRVDVVGEQSVGIVKISGRMNSPDRSYAAQESNWPSVVATMRFLVSTDANLECATYPLEFVWHDCDDNAFTFRGDLNTPARSRVIDCYDRLVETAQLAPSYGGPPVSCTDESVVAESQRGVIFYNAAVNIICAGGGAVYSRGDPNLNDIPYEMADAELLADFLLSRDYILLDSWACTFQSDVNGDGRSWMIDDLALMIGVIVGNVLPYGCDVKPPKYFRSRCFDRASRHHPLSPPPIPAPLELTDTAVFVADAASQTIEMISADSLGAMLLTFEGCVGVEVEVEGVDIRHSFDGVNTRVLVLSKLVPHEQFRHSYLRSPVSGKMILSVGGVGKLLTAEAATKQGCLLATVIKYR